MAGHTGRIRHAICECGSGKPYGECCLEHERHQTDVQVSYSLPRSVHPDVDVRWAIEDHLRVQAFNSFYRLGRDEIDPLIRFVRALLASAGPIRDPRLIRGWHRQFCARPVQDVRS